MDSYKLSIRWAMMDSLWNKVLCSICTVAYLMQKKQIQKKKEWHWENVFNTQNKSVRTTKNINNLCEKIIFFPTLALQNKLNYKKRKACFASPPGVTCNQCFTDWVYMNILFWFWNLGTSQIEFYNNLNCITATKLQFSFVPIQLNTDCKLSFY